MDIEIDNQSNQSEGQEQELYKNTMRQVKSCQRKSLSLIKDIFKKFNIYPEFTQ